MFRAGLHLVVGACASDASYGLNPTPQSPIGLVIVIAISYVLEVVLVFSISDSDSDSDSSSSGSSIPSSTGNIDSNSNTDSKNNIDEIESLKLDIVKSRSEICTGRTKLIKFPNN